MLQGSQTTRIALLDNVKFHYSELSINLIEAAEASVRHVPKYSPDFNPIEECISQNPNPISSLLPSIQTPSYCWNEKRADYGLIGAGNLHNRRVGWPFIHTLAP
jgi:hypothetical protein